MPKKKKIDSNYIKAVLSAYYRFKRSHKLIATEAGAYNSDFIAVSKKMVTEVEIKTSKSDFNNDFKKDKHGIYENRRSYWVPNQFYFAVPESMLEYAVTKLIGKPYGLIIIADTPHKRRSKEIGFNELFDSYWGKSIEEKCEKMAKRYYKNGNPKIEILSTSKGIIHFDDYIPWQDRARVVKQAKKLHDKPIDKRFMNTIVSRLSSEMANLRMHRESSS